MVHVQRTASRKVLAYSANDALRHPKDSSEFTFTDIVGATQALNAAESTCTRVSFLVVIPSFLRSLSSPTLQRIGTNTYPDRKFYSPFNYSCLPNYNALPLPALPTRQIGAGRRSSSATNRFRDLDGRAVESCNIPQRCIPHTRFQRSSDLRRRVLRELHHPRFRH